MNRFQIVFLLMSLAALSPAHLYAQTPVTKDAAPATAEDLIAKARVELATQEAAHPGNSAEVLKSLNDLIALERDGGKVDASTLELIDRAVLMAAILNGEKSEQYVGELGTQADLLSGVNRFTDAREVAERALEIAQSEFPNSMQTASVASELGMLCAKLGDYACAVRAHGISVDVARKAGGNFNEQLMDSLNNMGAMKSRMGDFDGAIKAEEEALAIAYHLDPSDLHNGVLENNLGSNYMKAQNFEKASQHLNRAVEMLSKLYGPESPRLMQIHRNLGSLYTRTGQFPLAWKAYEFSLENVNEPVDSQALGHERFAQSLAQGGNAQRAIAEGLTSAQMSRELFVLQSRTMPERQALAYDAVRPHGLDTSISVVLKHPELNNANVYQEMARSRALVADEMAHRVKNLNASNDPVVAQLLKELDQARADLMAAESLPASKTGNQEKVIAANSRMESIERTLARQSATLRNDERIYEVTQNDIRQQLPSQSVLISYVLYKRHLVDKVDPANSDTPSYVAFVLHSDSDQIHVYDLGDAKSIHAFVSSARAAADAEAHGGGLGATRNERAYRDAALSLRQRVWDPLKSELTNSKLVLVVPDGMLNLIPFSSFPDGDGYMVEHSPVIHMLTSERDLIPADATEKKHGLLAIGSPSFAQAANKVPESPLRGAEPACEELDKVVFQPLPAAAAEVSDIGSAWKQWNAAESEQLITGDDATLERFLTESTHNRVLHVATHAFLLDKSCGGGNPLMHSGLVFAGANQNHAASILTAQQIASLDLSGVDWAVLSACNTGNGELHDGEGVLGLERAFRVAGARSVVMTPWPVDDNVTRRFMQELYAQRLGQHASTADAVWNSARILMLERRAAGKSTNPWYWAGFIGSGGWE